MDSGHPNVPWWSVQVWLPWSVYLSQCQHSLVSGLTGPRRHEIIHLSFHLRTRKPFFTRPETSINYSDGRKSEERQIHLDLIGKQVCSRLLSRFPLRWSSRDNGAREREKRQREIADEVMERNTDGRTDGAKQKKGPTIKRVTHLFLVSFCNLESQWELSHDEWMRWLGLKVQMSLGPLTSFHLTAALCCLSHTNDMASISSRLSMNSPQWDNRFFFLEPHFC